MLILILIEKIFTLKNVELVTSGNFGPCKRRFSIAFAIKLLKSTRKTICVSRIIIIIFLFNFHK